MTGLLLFHGIVQATFLSGSLLEQQIYQMGRLASLVSLEQADLFSKKGYSGKIYPDGNNLGGQSEA